MRSQLYYTTFLVLSLFQLSVAFTVQRPVALSPPSTALHVGATIDWNPNENHDEAFIMARAVDCASSDACSLEEARTCLADIIHVQSACASGELLGTDVCEDVGQTAELVASLRQKIEDESKRLSSVKIGIDIINVALVAMVLAAFVAGLAPLNPEVAPFTPQEWWWAIRDGYLPTMLGHYFRHGGLAATADYQPDTLPFTLQEWWWAIKGGYLDSMTGHFFTNGGLASDPSSLQAFPLTSQEWMWSLKDGYFDRLLAENVQHGGLQQVGVLEHDVLPFTPQEWFWAFTHGYTGDMMDHFHRNGGL